jgi:hypothetical protein
MMSFFVKIKIKIVQAFIFLGVALTIFGCDRNVRSTLWGGLPVCYGKEDPSAEDLDAVVAFFIREDARRSKQKFFCGLVESGARFSLIEDRGRIVKPRWAPDLNYAWTYRENAYHESSEKLISLIRSILEKGEASKEGFIYPETGQLEHCPFVRSTLEKPFGPDLACEKEVRAKGFIRADEYQSKITD